MNDDEIMNAIQNMSATEMLELVQAGQNSTKINQSGDGNNIYVNGDVNITNNYYGKNYDASTSVEYEEELEEWEELGFNSEIEYLTWAEEEDEKRRLSSQRRNQFLLEAVTVPVKIGWVTTKFATKASWWLVSETASLLWWTAKYINGDTDYQRMRNRQLSYREEKEMVEEIVDTVIVKPTEEDYYQARMMLSASKVQEEELDEINRKFQVELAKRIA
jgi:hypothetical protein